MRASRCLIKPCLLKGINNDAETLAELSHALFSAGTLPYYLHVLDKVQGACSLRFRITRSAKNTCRINHQIIWVFGAPIGARRSGHVHLKH